MSKIAKLNLVFGAVLRDFRKEAGLSQERLALEAGLDRTFISLLERGLRQPSLKTLFTVAAVLKVPPHQLVLTVETTMQLK